MAQREIRVASINVAGVLLMHGVTPIRIMRHDKTGAPLLCFVGNATNQDILNRYNAGRDAASEIIENVERETSNGTATDPQ
jgi:hypothetical protein